MFDKNKMWYLNEQAYVYAVEGIDLNLFAPSLKIIFLR